MKDYRKDIDSSRRGERVLLLDGSIARIIHSYKEVFCLHHGEGDEISWNGMMYCNESHFKKLEQP